MSIGITIATVMFCFYLYQYLEEKRKAKEEDRFVESSISEAAKDNKGDAESWMTKTLVKGVLRRIGCEPEEEDEGEHGKGCQLNIAVESHCRSDGCHKSTKGKTDDKTVTRCHLEDQTEDGDNCPYLPKIL